MQYSPRYKKSTRIFWFDILPGTCRRFYFRLLAGTCRTDKNQGQFRFSDVAFFLWLFLSFMIFRKFQQSSIFFPFATLVYGDHCSCTRSETLFISISIPVAEPEATRCSGACARTTRMKLQRALRMLVSSSAIS